MGIENLHLIFENQKDLLEIALSILNDRLIDHTKQENFDECLASIIQFYNKQDQINAYNEAIANASNKGFLEKYNEYLKLKEGSVKIIRKENTI